MNALDPPQQDPPASPVRELVQALHDYLDLPPVADSAEEPKRDTELTERVARVVGLLEVVLAGGTVQDAAETIRASQALALPFTPETPAQTAERHTRLAALLAGRRRSGPNGGTADRGPDGTVSV
jgi:hypothetical protein